MSDFDIDPSYCVKMMVWTRSYLWSEHVGTEMLPCVCVCVRARTRALYLDKNTTLVRLGCLRVLSFHDDGR